jgi:hypothetical protein
MSFAEWWNLVKRNRDYPGRMYAQNGRIRKGRKPLRKRRRR